MRRRANPNFDQPFISAERVFVSGPAGCLPLRLLAGPCIERPTAKTERVRALESSSSSLRIFATLVLCGSHLSFVVVVQFFYKKVGPFFLVPFSSSPLSLVAGGVLSEALSVFPHRSQILIEVPRAEEGRDSGSTRGRRLVLNQCAGQLRNAKCIPASTIG